MSIEKSELKGLFTAIVTPFKGDGAVDFVSLKALVERQIAAGATGIVPIGGTGEYPGLSRDERFEVVGACVEAAAGHPVLPGVLSTGYHDALDAGRDFKAAGAAGLMLVTPYYSTGSQDGIRRYYNEYRSDVDLPLMAYEIPRRTNVTINPETYRKLADDDAIIGMKFSNYDMPSFISILNETGGRLAILSGEEPLFATHVALGAVGGVLASASLYPRHWIDVFEQARVGNIEGALALQSQIAPILSAIYRETNPGPLKYFMKLAGYDVGGVRIPLTNPTNETIEKLESVVDSMNENEG